MILPIEIYTADRIEEFDAAEADLAELMALRKADLSGQKAVAAKRSAAVKIESTHAKPSVEKARRKKAS